MHHFEKKIKISSQRGPAKMFGGRERLFPWAPLWLSTGLFYYIDSSKRTYWTPLALTQYQYNIWPVCCCYSSWLGHKLQPILCLRQQTNNVTYRQRMPADQVSWSTVQTFHSAEKDSVTWLHKLSIREKNVRQTGCHVFWYLMCVLQSWL